MNKVTNITDSKLNQAQQEIAHLKSLLLDAYTHLSYIKSHWDLDQSTVDIKFDELNSHHLNDNDMAELNTLIAEINSAYQETL